MVCLREKFDFEAAKQKLVDCENLLSMDFFLYLHKDTILLSARLFMFESFISIHRRVETSQVAHRLGLDVAEAQQWVNKLMEQRALPIGVNETNTIVFEDHSVDVFSVTSKRIEDLSGRSREIERKLKLFEEQAATKFAKKGKARSNAPTEAKDAGAL